MKGWNYLVQVGERGRVVLPAPLRRKLDVHDGDQLLFPLDDVGLPSLRVVKASDAAAAGRGLFADDSGRSLVDELLDERRGEARRDLSLLDASAMLAYLHGETGGDIVADVLAGGERIGAANFAETLSKLADAGRKPSDVVDQLRERGILDGLLGVER